MLGGLPVHVESRSNAPEVGGVVVPVVVDSDQPGIVQLLRRIVHELAALRLQGRVVLKILRREAVLLGRPVKPHEEVRVPQPVGRVFLAGDVTDGDLGVEGVGHVFQELGLDRHLVQQQPQVAVQLIVRGDQRRVALAIETGSSGAAEDLLNIQDSEILEAAACRVEDIRSLDDNCPSWQVHAPRQGRGAAQDTQNARQKHLLGHRPVGSQHTRMVHAEAIREQLSHLPVPGFVLFPLPIAVLLVHPVVQGALLILLLRHLRQGARRLVGVPSRVHEDHHLVAPLHLFHHEVITNLIQLGH
mmetsp:Transcript_115361/g.366864  ORF Transcript_115361/g.366864 Transcript_115361/m.366864 type:complete len:301 (+) Transcript_115361:3850-4752(+)